MLSDERILRLLNDAHRAQAWHDGEAPKVHVPISRPARSASSGWKLRVGAYVAAAACIALAMTAVMLPRSTTRSNTWIAKTQDAIQQAFAGPGRPKIDVFPPTPVGGSSGGTTLLSEAEPESVLMAIVQDDVGDVRCVRWSCADFDGRQLNELKENELRTAGLAMLCQERPSRLVVVAMQGPKQSMPTSDSHATHLARCIMAAPACDAGSMSMRDCNGGACVGSDVQVRVEAVAMR